jgi:hypothetical protein
MNETEAFVLFQTLGNYLKTEVESSFGMVQKSVRKGSERAIVEEEGPIVRVKVTNTAPVEPKWPLVVFTGVAIAFNPKRWNNSIIMKRNTSYRVDLSNAPQGGFWGLLGDKQYFRKANGEDFPMMTSDEIKHGYTLYPGQSIMFELSVKAEDMKNIRIEGNLSRRHLCHYVKELSS